MTDRPSHMDFIAAVSEQDLVNLESKERTYGSSWKRRGGVGAFMMAARKWDRLEGMLQRLSWDVFGAIASQSGERQGTDGTVLAEVRDLRRYLLLIEAEMMATRCVEQLEGLADYQGAEVPTVSAHARIQRSQERAAPAPVVAAPAPTAVTAASVPGPEEGHLSPVHAAAAASDARDDDAHLTMGDLAMMSAAEGMSHQLDRPVLVRIMERRYDAVGNSGWTYMVELMDSQDLLEEGEVLQGVPQSALTPATAVEEAAE